MKTKNNSNIDGCNCNYIMCGSDTKINNMLFWVFGQIRDRGLGKLTKEKIDNQ